MCTVARPIGLHNRHQLATSLMTELRDQLHLRIVGGTARRLTVIAVGTAATSANASAAAAGSAANPERCNTKTALV